MILFAVVIACLEPFCGLPENVVHSKIHAQSETMCVLDVGMILVANGIDTRKVKIECTPMEGS